MAWKKISETHYEKTTHWGTISVSINRFGEMWKFQIKTAEGKKSEEEFPTKKRAMSAMNLYMHLNSYGGVVEGRSGKGNKHGGKGWHESPGADGKAPIHKEVATRAQAKHAQNTPMKKRGYFIMMEDKMGNITLSHSGSKRVAFFQAEADKEFISDLLKKGEKEDLENGYNVEIKDSEPRASVLDELLEARG